MLKHFDRVGKGLVHECLAALRGRSQTLMAETVEDGLGRSKVVAMYAKAGGLSCANPPVHYKNAQMCALPLALISQLR